MLAQNQRIQNAIPRAGAQTRLLTRSTPIGARRPGKGGYERLPLRALGGPVVAPKQQKCGVFSSTDVGTWYNSNGVTSLWFFLRSRSVKRNVGAVLTLGLGLAGLGFFANGVSEVYPVRDWLFWEMLKLWGWIASFAVGCVCFGQFVVVRLLRLERLSVLESTLFSMSTGTLGFGIAMYVAGASGHFDAPFAVGLPLGMMGIGAHDGAALMRRIRTETAAARHGWLSWAITGYGLVFLLLVYFGAMTPDSISVDASMVHLRIAEDYARTGRLVPFPTNYHTCVPHLASILSTWAFIVPGLRAAQHWMLALHLEFCLFVFTCVGVAAAIQRIVDDHRLRAAWVAIFLFPGFFAADSNLSCGADHVVAFFSIAITLAALRVCKNFTRADCVLLGMSLAGALLTKYQAVYLLTSSALVVSLTWAYKLFLDIRRMGIGSPSRHRRDLLIAPLIVVLTIAVFTSPHFIKNTVFYHNPVYPFMTKVFSGSTPHFPNATIYIEHLYEDKNWVPPGSLFDKLSHASELFLTFSFKPHYFLNNTPYFGSLFTLLFPAILFVPKKTNVLRAATIGAGSLLLWGMTFNVDRNLQTFMPVLACVTGALIVKLWRFGWLARVGLIPLVGFQVVWGGDLPLFDGRGDRMRSAMDLIAAGDLGKAKTRFDEYRRLYVDLGEAVPDNSRLLLHLGHDALGIDRELWLDRPGFQGLISYQNVRSARELYDYYRSLGITHVILDGREDHAAAVQDEALFRILVRQHAKSLGTFGSYNLFELPRSSPPAENPYKVLALGISGYTAGLYPIEHLGTIEYLAGNLKKYSSPQEPYTPANAASLLARADVVVMRRDFTIEEQLRSAITSQFESVDNWKEDIALYHRRIR